MNPRSLAQAIFVLLLLYVAHAQAASFTATVDRTELSAGESVALILESDDTTQFLTPDLTPLKPLFELLNSQQVNRFNAAGQPVTQWVLTLLPKHTGLLIIPPLSLGELHSAPINLFVKEFNPDSISPLEPVYIDTQLDREWVYLQAQLILTLRIYHSVPLFAGSNLTPLLLDNARVEQLGKPRTFEQHINGVRHGVIEVSYAIFPQQSGQLDIPAQTFTATLAGHNPQSLTPFSARPGQRIKVKSAQIPLPVKAIPSAYPKDATWLPAAQLSLEQTWTPSLESAISSGSAITRLLQVQVKGLPDTQLPALQPAPSDAYKVYLDKPSFSHQHTEQGVFSSRAERHAYVFQNSGQQHLAAIKLPWWNTTTDQLEYAELVEHSVHVTAAKQQHSSLEPAALDNTAPVPTDSIDPVLLWQAISALLLVLAIIGYGLWWRARHQPAVIASQSNGPNARDLLDNLKRACLANDPQASRHALDAWARQQTIPLVELAATDSALSDALDALNSALYSESSSPWQGQALWHAIDQLPAESSFKAEQEQQLPPLYPP